jgi:hypothetical protein
MMVFMTIVLLGVGIGLAIVGYHLIRFPHEGLKNIISYHALGEIEGSLPDLERVIVVADRIEDPEHELRDAVRANFAKGVRYLFLVSKSTAQAELQGYYKIFRALAEIVTKNPVTNLVDIQELPYDWPNFPYVFYETKSKGASQPNFVAFRGSQRREGIADFYSPVESGAAYILARAVLSDSPHPITVTSDQFEEAGNVLSFPEDRAS